MWVRYVRSYDESDYLINLSEDVNIFSDGKGLCIIKLIIYILDSYDVILIIFLLLYNFCFINVFKFY